MKARCRICKEPATRRRGLAALCSNLDCEVQVKLVDKPNPDAKPMARSVWKKKGKKPSSASDKRHMISVAELGCIVCRNLGYGITPAELHHPRELAGGGQKSSNEDVIPLCPIHHRLGCYGVAYHAGPKAWEEAFGTELELLAQTKRELGL